MSENDILPEVVGRMGTRPTGAIQKAKLLVEKDEGSYYCLSLKAHAPGMRRQTCSSECLVLTFDRVAFGPSCASLPRKKDILTVIDLLRNLSK